MLKQQTSLYEFQTHLNMRQNNVHRGIQCGGFVYRGDNNNATNNHDIKKLPAMNIPFLSVGQSLGEYLTQESCE